MSSCRLVLSTLLAGMFFTSALAQQTVPTPLPPIRGRSTGNNPPATHPKREPCWEVAGISKAAIEQRRALARQAREEIEAVCANSSLTMQQRHEQIRAIHEREKQQANALVTPQQEQALKACQESRGHGHGGFGGGGGGRGMGPCGEMPATRRPRGTSPPTKGTPPTTERDEED